MVSSMDMTMTATNYTTKRLLNIKDPGSALTHFIGMLLAIIAAFPLLIRASHQQGLVYPISMTVFISSMILLYGASTTYHTLNISPRINRILKKVDHMMIFILIAGSYTPICTIALNNSGGTLLLALVWSIAIGGILVKALWINCPKWFSSVLYIAMGWLCVFSFRQIIAALPTPAFWWLLIGGILYTVGGVIYAIRFRGFNTRHPYFGTHEIFHLFVMAGSFCHFIVMYQYVVFMPL